MVDQEQIRFIHKRIDELVGRHEESVKRIDIMENTLKQLTTGQNDILTELRTNNADTKIIRDTVTTVTVGRKVLIWLASVAVACAAIWTSLKTPHS